MNAAAARPKTGFKFVLIVQGGPDKGASYQLLPPQVTIGRDASANITLSDPRVSRQAALIEFSMERILITDTGSRKTMLVDGSATAKAEIADGTVIQIGNTQLLFRVEAIPLGPGTMVGTLQQTQNASQFTAKNNGMLGDGQTVRRDSKSVEQTRIAPLGQPQATSQLGGYDAPTVVRRPQATGKITPFHVIVAFLVLAALYLGLAETTKRNTAKGITTSTDIQKEIDSSEKLQEDLKKKRQFSSEEEKTRYEEANRHYLEGFRDYQNLQYSRALRSFETALAIDPANELARRYYNLAQKQRDDMVANLILEGRTYRDKLMYARCSSALEKALNFMTNRDDLKFKQAEAMKKECDLLMDGRN